MVLKIDYLIDVHSLPVDLAQALSQPDSDLYATAKLYERLVLSDLLWRVWQVDEYGELWLEVNTLDCDGEPVFETLKLDEGSYRKVPFEPYEVISA